jgi:formyltetrahydrofolate deformylase
MTTPTLILTISCPDRRGIVAEVTRFLFERGCNILDSQQFGDRVQGRFFLRIHFVSENGLSQAALEQDFAAIAAQFDMMAYFFDSAVKTRAIIMVSKFGHALVDLLYRCRIGSIPLEIPLIVSNHRDFEDVGVANHIPFVHLPVTKETKTAQEKVLARLIAEHKIDL